MCSQTELNNDHEVVAKGLGCYFDRIQSNQMPKQQEEERTETRESCHHTHKGD